MYEVLDIRETGRGNYGIALIGGEVILTYGNRREARREAKRLNSQLADKVSGKRKTHARAKKA